MIKDGVVGLVADGGLIIGLLIYMFSINWQLALITLAIMPILFFTLNVLRSRMRDAFRAVSLRRSKSNTYLSENLSGMKTVQLFNREVRNQAHYDQLNLDLLDARLEQVRWFSLFFPAVQFTGAISIALILFYGTSQIVGTGQSAVTIGVLTAFIQYSFMFFRPLQDLSDKFNIIQAAMASSERIFGLTRHPRSGAKQRRRPTILQAFRAKLSLTMCRLPTKTTNGCCATCHSPSNPGSQ